MKSSRAHKYEKAYLEDFGFEEVMVHYRRMLVLERLAQYAPRVVIEIGCGNELQYEAWLKTGSANVDSWIIVEPAPQFAQAALAANLPNCHVIHATLENSVGRIQRLLPRAPDMIIFAGVLHEVPSPAELLNSAKSLMGPEGILHVNVPNSESFHRRLAKSMGLISSTKTMSDRNNALMQHRVYDMNTLHTELIGGGFKIAEQGGYLIKPFTHAQMERVCGELGSQVLDGLFHLGKELPELASEIWVEAFLNE